LLYRSFTTSSHISCLLCSSHNEGTVVLTMWVCTTMMWRSMFHSIILSCLLIKMFQNFWQDMY
jgi:hypothetical protein